MADSKVIEPEPEIQKNTVKRKGVFPCSQCSYSSDWRSNIRLHAARVHKTLIRMYDCCGIHFPDKAAFGHHEMTYHPRRHMCKICGLGFHQEPNLKRHMATHQSRSKKSKGILRGYATSCNDDLNQHFQLHKNEDEKNNCSPKSRAPVDSFHQDSSASNIQLKETVFTCQYCSFETKWRDSLHRHRKTQHRITMGSRGTIFGVKRSYRKHASIDQRQRFMCTTCNQVFSSSTLLKYHQSVHPGHKPFKCNLCDFTSLRLWNLNHHKILRHKEDNLPIVLQLSSQPILSDRLPTENSHPNEEDVEVPRVQLSRSSPSPFVGQEALEPNVENGCNFYDIKQEVVEECSLFQESSFSKSLSDPIIDSADGETDELNSQTSLVETETRLLNFEVNNEKSSTQEARIFSCTICPHSTKWPNALKRHLKIHEKQGLFPPPSPPVTVKHVPPSSKPQVNKSAMLTCSLCPYSTRWASHFKMHTARMHKKKKCKCTTCGRIFGNRFVLQRHQIGHSVVKKFRCSVCDYSSSQQGHVDRHMKTHKRKNDFPSTGQAVQCDTPLEVRRLRSSLAIASERKENKSFSNNSYENGRATLSLETETMVLDVEQSHQHQKKTKIIGYSRSESAHSILPSRELRRSGRLAVGPAASPSEDSCDNLPPLTVINSIHEEARLLRYRASLAVNVSTLLSLLLRLLELSSSSMRQIHAALEVEVRAQAIECFEYVWNASKMAIIRWEHLKGTAIRDTSFNAVRYVYETLPVFINWDKNEHPEILENTILLSLNTVKNWKQSSANSEAAVLS